jgi:hypothetical protein
MRPRLILPILVAAALACNTLAPPRPTVAWDPAPEAVVLRATECCGLVPPYYAENYIPEVHIWGDGRIVWVENQGRGARRLLEGALTEAQLEALLQRIVDAGFFGWADSYADYRVTDLPTQCLRVELSSQTKQVCEYYTGAPEAFHTLFAAVTGGAGAAGVEFIPAQAQLSVWPTQPSQNVKPEDYLDWDPAATGFSLAQVTGRRDVDGNALALAWRAVNRNLWFPLVRDGDDFYYVVVTVPGLSYVQ